VLKEGVRYPNHQYFIQGVDPLYASRGICAFFSDGSAM
jgi:hypothetical protein